MRIALYHNLPSGGAKRTLYEETKRLAATHSVDVYTLSSGNHEFADVRPYVANHFVYPFQPKPLLNSPFGRLNKLISLTDLLALQRIAQTIAADIEQNGYDVLLAHPCQFEKAPSVLTFVRHVPTVYYCHESLRLLYERMPARPYDDSASWHRPLLNRLDPLLALYNRISKKIDRKNTQKATHVLVNSRFTQQMIRQNYLVDPAVSYHGVDVNKFKPMPVEKEPILLSVGSLTILKGFDFLVESLAYMPPEQRLSLVLASNFHNPQEKQYLEQLAAAKQVEIRFLGNVDDAQLVALYNQAALTLYAPIREPFGLVPLESMACGTAVVAVREGGIPETVLPGETGLLTERDPQKFAQAVTQLVMDPVLAEQYGRSGRAHVLQNWTWERATETLVHYLQQASEQRPLLMPTH